MTAIVAVGAWHVLALGVLGAGLYVSGHAVVDGGVGATDLLPAAAATLVLLTLRPYGHGFVAPGPRLIRGEQPELFAALDHATDAVAVDRYDEVYVDGSARAEVVQRDGVFGFGGRRTLVIGSPLLQTLSIDHLRALVAHEAVRYYGSTNRLAAFVERSRARMRSGLDELARGKGGLTSLPFALYAAFFLRATTQLSNEHRIATDELVADRIGALQIAELLTMTAGMPAVLDAYASVYAGPNGPRFEDFAASEEAARVSAFARFRRSENAASHAEPPLDERLMRLDALVRASRVLDERPASVLVSGFEHIARRQLADRFART